ncbi:host specificity factor TipJ family phage tail protein [Pelosinus sp. IPA-1]|uniref:host specificity protein J n=1 Tax=Pelosinus sp. IPA-1 TaxID=3029569 RepID=UPI00243616BC|nr:host specificity factor TipJ family phage tail protein [Pelosinus sp. IPA-1]GMB00244.1 hypothetical protein PIPA1_30430 [Pelosinus sp. IPA-1]
MSDITLTILKNPFNISDREIKKIAYAPRKTISEYIQPVMMGIKVEEMVVSRNGAIVGNELLSSLPIESGDYIAVCPVVGKGGGKNILRMIATVALMAYTGNIAAGHGWGATLGGAGSWGASLAAGAISMVGGMLINHLFPQPMPEMPSADMVTSTPTYSWGGLQSLSGQGNALAVTYGTMRTAGQILAQHVTNGDGDKQYLNLLLCGGEGPVDSITDIKINDNPISYYTDVAKPVLSFGTNDQVAIPYFNDTYADQALNYELIRSDDWLTTQQTEGNGGGGLEITLECPNGLYYANDQGSLDKATVKVQGRYRKVGADAWICWDEWTITAAQNNAVRKVYRIDNLPVGKYEVQCRCSYKSNKDESPRYCTKVYWTQLSHIIHEDFSRPGKVLVAIRALATDQLSGGLPTVTWLQSVETVNVYNPINGQYEKKPARIPAWVAYDLLHRCKKIKNTQTRADEYVVFGIPANRIDYQAFADWAAFCAERKLDFEHIFDTASDLWSSLQKPESVGRGKVILKGTRYSCVCDRPTQPVQLFTMGNIVQDKFQEDFLGIKDRANAVEISFINKDKGYQKDTLTIYGDEWDSLETIQNPTQITLYGCTSYKQAYREGKYRLRLNQYLQRTVSFDADIDAIACQVGDVILIQHDIPQWGYGGRVLAATENTIQFDHNITMEAGKEYSVMVRLADDTLVEKQVIGAVAETDTVTVSTSFTSIPQKWDVFSFGENYKVSKPFRVVNISRSQEFKRSITALEYVEAIYTEADNIPVINYSDLDNSAPEVSNLSLGQQTYRQKDGTIISEIDCSWIVPKQYIKNSIVWYSRDGGQSWVLWGNTTNNLAVITGVKSQETYLVKVCTLNYSGVVSPGIISKGIYITGKDEPPSDISILSAWQDISDSTKVVLQWSVVKDIDLKGYEIRVGTSWDAGEAITSIVYGTTFTYTTKKDGVYNFFIKAVDNSGNYSVTAKITTLDIVITPNTISNFNVKQLETDRSRLKMTWDMNIENDLAYYEIRQGDNWDTAKITATQIKATFFEYQLLEEGNYSFLIKAVNVAGNMSIHPGQYTKQYTLRPNAPSSGGIIQDRSDKTTLVVSWDNIPDKDLYQYEVRLGNAWDIATSIATTKELNIRYKLALSGRYNLMIRAQNVAGYMSNILNLTIDADIEAMDITGFSATQLSSDRTKVRLQWNTPSELDIAYCEIRKGPTWDSSVVIGNRVTGTFFDTIIAEESKQIFWIKAVNIGGIYSQFPVSAEGIFNLNPDCPTNLQAMHDSNDRSNVIISWTGIIETDLFEYELRVGYTWNSSSLVAKTKESQVTYRPSDSGDVKFIIKAKNTAGFYSDELFIHFNARLEPADVVGFQVIQNGDNVQFLWQKSIEPDVVGYEIREGSTFENGMLVTTGITQTFLQVPIDTERTYRYHIKAINRSGFYSQRAMSVSIVIIGLLPKNTIQTYDEVKLQNGTATNVEFAPSLINFSNFEGLFSDYPTTRYSEVGGQKVLKLQQQNGVYMSTGEYCCQRKDLEQVITANISTQFVTSILRCSGVMAKLQYRISTDSMTWNAWRDFSPVLATFRYIDFRVQLATSDLAKTPEVNQFTINIDVPDTDKAGMAIIASGGSDISYGYNYYTLPSVLPTAIGQGVRAELISIAKDKFRCRVINSTGQDVDNGKITWISKGY